MNNYYSYKIRKWLESSVDKFFDIVFYIPRKQYKENVNFKTWIDNRSSVRYNKNRMKRTMDKIFRTIENSEDGVCVMYLARDFDMNIPSDYDGYEYKFLLENDDWIKKNKLNVEQMRFEDYITKYKPGVAYRFQWYHWINSKDEIVLRITKLGK